ncbi:hypothetical protein Pcinc_023878 [Petrolisthes cinctipes]|uniref:Uncharacterized protein n=1 Tax=Petrolisthes cinctipes TaxID=88211 RepID=A0AAE1FBN5_PETCI|nr:hypothetical protein Pcinc_023878 [Petrolisthes cinctipes]
MAAPALVRPGSGRNGLESVAVYWPPVWSTRPTSTEYHPTPHLTCTLHICQVMTDVAWQVWQETGVAEGDLLWEGGRGDGRRLRSP